MREREDEEENKTARWKDPVMVGAHVVVFIGSC
jgi:hypothetical protein